LRDWLEHTLAWHRKSELGRYAGFVDEVAAGATRTRDKAGYNQLRARFESYIDDLVQQTAPDASRLLLELTPQQTSELLKSLGEKADARKEKYAKAVASRKWQREQREDAAKQLKRWTGAVTDEQATIIAAAVSELEPTYLDWAASQQSWRDTLQKVLAEDHSAAATRQRLAALLRHPEQHWTAAYAQKIARNRDRYVNLVVALDATLSGAQRARLRDELRKLSAQLRKLAESKE
jgi:hypothetical protein